MRTCTNCGAELPTVVRFCTVCGTPALPPQLARPGDGSVVLKALGLTALVCAGLIALVFLLPSAPKPQTDPAATVDLQVFVCPAAGCEVGTDVASAVALLMYQEDTPTDTSGIFSSAQKAEMYREFVNSGKIITVQNHTHGDRKYHTPLNPENPAQVSVVKLLDGDYVGRVVLVPDRYLR